jgi:hypothetical protein
LARRLGTSVDTAVALLRRHVQLCYDTCHFAVAYEAPADALAHLRAARVPVGKVQLSAALRVPLSGDRTDVARRLRPFAESTYLHQVVERRADGSLRAYRDLPDALPHLHDPGAREWRIHYHVPIDTETYDGLHSTQPDIVRTLNALRADDACAHLEIETYTYDVLPPALQTDLATSLRREYDWVLATIGTAEAHA